MANDSPNWRRLWDISWSTPDIWTEMPPSLIDRDSAVANAVRSGDVAVRGQLASELGLGFSASSSSKSD